VKVAAASSAFPLTLQADPTKSSLGSGVDVEMVTRVRDQFLDQQFRDVTVKYGEQDTFSGIMNQIEGLFNEPSDTGLQKLMSKYWEAWNEVSKRPTEAAARANLRETGTAMTNRFNEIGSGLLKLREDIDDRIGAAVKDVNGMIDQLAQLNAQISAALGANVQPNNLMDQRDLLLDKLSRYTRLEQSQRSDGTTWVFIFGKAVVQGDKAQKLELVNNGELSFNSVAYDKEPIPPAYMGGIFKGLFDMRDKVIGRPVVPPGSIQPNTPGGLAYQLDVLANKLATSVNDLHRAGSTLQPGYGPDFFTIDSSKGVASQFNATIINASNMSLNPVFSANGGAALDLIAAGRAPGGAPGSETWPPKGDNGTALAISQLQFKLVTDGTIASAVTAGKFTAEDFYRNVLTSLGVQGQTSKKLLDNQKALLEHVDNLRQTVQGVNLDEEMANMIKFQHTYAASARMINTFDGLLDRVINQMGTVGR